MKKHFFVFILLFLISIPVSAASYGWGFTRNNEHRTPEIGKYAAEIRDTNSFYIGDPNKKIVYLTFDAGYDNGNLSQILDVLREKNVKSTFFLTGDFLEREQALLQRIVAEGHLVGNHTWGHKDITKLSKEQLREQLELFDEKYYQIFNTYPQKLFRPPAGQFNKESLMRVKDLGYYTFFWSIAFKDWLDDKRGADYAYNNVINNLHNGAIILLHTVSSDNALALGMIIDKIYEDGYEIKNIDYLIQASIS